jgi:ribonuclease HI
VTRTRTHTYSDGRAATAVVALVWECTQALEEDSGSNTLTLEWIPGHHRISGNEEGDKLGNEGINKFPFDHPVGIPFAVGKDVIRVI